MGITLKGSKKSKSLTLIYQPTVSRSAGIIHDDKCLSMDYCTLHYTRNTYTCTKSFRQPTCNTLFQLSVHRVMLLIFTIWLFAKAA